MGARKLLCQPNLLLGGQDRWPTHLNEIQDSQESQHRWTTNLNEIQDPQLTLRRVNTKHKVQCGVVTIDQLVVGAPDQPEKDDKVWCSVMVTE